MYSTQESRIELVLQLMDNLKNYLDAAPDKLIEEGDGWKIGLSGHPFPFLNDVLLYANNPDAVEKTIGILEERSLPAFIKVVGSAQNQIPLLLEKGYKFIYSSPVMVWDADDSLKDFTLRDGLSIRRLERDEKSVVWEVYEDVYGMPAAAREAFSSFFMESERDFTYGLFKDGELVSLVTALVDGDFVGIWGMGTPTHFQKNGYGAELLREVMRRHVEMGGVKFALYASDAGKILYDKLNWKTIEYYSNYGLATPKVVSA